MNKDSLNNPNFVAKICFEPDSIAPIFIMEDSTILRPYWQEGIGLVWLTESEYLNNKTQEENKHNFIQRVRNKLFKP